MRIRWDPAPLVAERCKVDPKTMRNWVKSGYVEGRREGPRLIVVKVHDEPGDLEGRPVTLDDQERRQ